MDSKRRVSVIGIIPARRESTRFPLKMLAPLLGKPLICHTFENASRFSIFDDLFVATDCEEIERLVSPKGILTKAHKSGTDRCAEAASILGVDDEAIIVNVQGDEPLLEEDIVGRVVNALIMSKEASMATAVTDILSIEEANNPSVVKCVTDTQGFALYFSRALIPKGKGFNPNTKYLRHLGIYAFRAKFLKTFASLEATPLQLAEDLEQLKALENGYRIQTVYGETKSISVDTLEDLKQVEKRLCNPNTFSQPAESALRSAKA